MPGLLQSPLTPDPDQARSWLRAELLRPEYNDRNLIQRALDWLQRLFDLGVNAAGAVPPLSIFLAMLVGLALVSALLWLAARASTARTSTRQGSALLGETVTSSAELRARAEAALADSRVDDALVDAFRALAMRQIEGGVLDDRPGATVHEVTGDLGRVFPDRAADLEHYAARFDSVVYGKRPAAEPEVRSLLKLGLELPATALVRR